MFTFRPHHFMCTLSFQGLGYSKSFVKNYNQIVAKLRATDGEKIEIQVVTGNDNICKPCPNRQDTTCKYQDKISKLDNAHAKALEISIGDKLTWGEAKTRIHQKIPLEVFHQICNTCSWKELGICEKTLIDLHNYYGQKSDTED